ncbi:xylose isomerase-like protein [Aspergillus cavernicola]|uniref:Xylose isomerase-like protein n=1 Tax=Aspergillus cavernicola TaxID=176166 RepID=A0ABR4HVT4_9EURO
MNTTTSIIPTSYATCSLNPPTTPLPSKLKTLASKSPFTGIELSFPDLLSYASTLHNNNTNTKTEIKPNNYPALCAAASNLRALCTSLNLQVIMLQPFSNFEGWPRGSNERSEAFERARGWIEIMDAGGIRILQVGSSDTPLEKLSGFFGSWGGQDREEEEEEEKKKKKKLRRDIVDDLQELGTMLAERGMDLAYENWCWSSHAPGWKDVWDIVEEVDRENVGLCLDTFQSAGGEFGDPTTESGLIGGVESGSPGERELKRRFEGSMGELSVVVPKEKIFLLQVSDAYRPSKGPLEAGVVDGTAARGRWSHDFRPMPYDGGYLPIEDVGRAVLKTGFRGWFSMEIFDGGKDGEWGKREECDIGEFVERSGGSMARFIDSCLSQG